MPTKDKRDLILECLQDRHTSADAILNHLHQNGWMVVEKSERCDCVKECGDREGRGICRGLPGFARQT